MIARGTEVLRVYASRSCSIQTHQHGLQLQIHHPVNQPSRRANPDQAVRLEVRRTRTGRRSRVCACHAVRFGCDRGRTARTHTGGEHCSRCPKGSDIPGAFTAHTTAGSLASDCEAASTDNAGSDWRRGGEGPRALSARTHISVRSSTHRRDVSPRPRNHRPRARLTQTASAYVPCPEGPLTRRESGVVVLG